MPAKILLRNRKLEIQSLQRIHWLEAIIDLEQSVSNYV